MSEPRAPRGEQASAAPRRPTADPDRFLIPSEHLPPGFAERVEDGALVPVDPRAAATVVLMREGAGGPEALLLRRPQRSRFAAGAWVFPGGAVDAQDASPELAARNTGPTPDQWAARLGVVDPAEGFAYAVAAVREAWEETGILLAAGGEAERLRAARAELLAGAGFAALIAREGVRLATGELLYIAHWITPEPEPRRYDTRFFLGRVPEGAQCELQGGELAESRWVTPEAAVQAYEAGELRLLPPTLHTLRRLAGFRSLDALWHALRDAPVPAFLPRMRRDPEGVVIEVTGEP